MWAPLLDKQLAIDPVWSSPSPVPSPFSLASSSASLKRKRPASGSTASTVTPSSRADTSPLQAILELSCKSHSIAVASATPSSSKIKSLRAELDQLSTRLRDKLNTPPLAKLLLEVEVRRLQALTDEIGGPRDASLEGKWSTSACEWAAKKLAPPRTDLIRPGHSGSSPHFDESACGPASLALARDDRVPPRSHLDRLATPR